jgi:hypothetical protein
VSFKITIAMSLIKLAILSFRTIMPFCMDYKKDINLGNGQHAFSPDNTVAEERKAFYVALSQRTEKAATAIYMVTSHIDDREGIKASFRDAALSLVLETISLEDFLHPVEEIFQSINLAILKIHSLLNLASALGMVSANNARILQAELTAIKDQSAAGHKYYALATLDDVLKTIYPEDAQTEKALDNGHAAQLAQSVSETSPKKEKPDVSHAAVSKKEQRSAEAPIPTIANAHRKDAIVQLIKDKGEVSIKDISQNFYDCSEKTIQRDINALVDEGRLSKTGDRRWSRYSVGK